MWGDGPSVRSCHSFLRVRLRRCLHNSPEIQNRRPRFPGCRRGSRFRRRRTGGKAHKHACGGSRPRAHLGEVKHTSARQHNDRIATSGRGTTWTGDRGILLPSSVDRRTLPSPGISKSSSESNLSEKSSSALPPLFPPSSAIPALAAGARGGDGRSACLCHFGSHGRCGRVRACNLPHTAATLRQQRGARRGRRKTTSHSALFGAS